jgi:hypothetical protein
MRQSVWQNLSIQEPFMSDAFRPLVVGAPRTGFTLLCSVLIHLCPLKPSKYALKNKIFKLISHELGNSISFRIKQTFQAYDISDALIYNPAFQFITGGPKWLDSDNPEQAVIRKYIGVKGLGDFTLNIKHPREILDNDEIVHSHSHPELWLNQAYYDDYTKFSSVRNPSGTLNSSIFSINALTSEYIQRFVPAEKDNDNIRQELALYKFTDLDFFEGLVLHLKSYLEEFLAVQDAFHIMRWEDLIQQPVTTIQNIASACNIVISAAQAKDIWSKLGHLNLSGTHKHNYRQGKGIVDDWMNSMTNHHLAIMQAHGFDDIAIKLGYGALTFLDESKYTDFQKQIDGLIRKNQIYDAFPDPDLFTFAFNKSNLISDKYPFKRYDWKQATQIERSCFKDEAMALDIWATAEESAILVNEVLMASLSLDYSTPETAQASLESLKKSFKPAFEYLQPGLFDSTYEQTLKLIAQQRLSA